MKVKIKILVGVVLCLFVAFVLYLFILAGFNKSEQNSDQNISRTTPSNSSQQTFSIVEVAKHTTSADCWVIIHGVVYNLTPFIKKHSGGGGAIINSCGKDGTKTFETKNQEPASPHSNRDTSVLTRYIVGVLN